MIDQEFMFEIYVRDSADETADVDPYDVEWGYTSDGTAHLFAVRYMEELAAQGHNTDHIYCVFQKDHNDYLDDKLEFATYDCLDYSDIDFWIAVTRQDDPDLFRVVAEVRPGRRESEEV
jgi:hypothetical protein